MEDLGSSNENPPDFSRSGEFAEQLAARLEQYGTLHRD